MTMQDPMADMLTRIRNAQLAGITDLVMPSSQLKAAVAQVLQDEGYIENHQVTQSEGGKADLSITLRYYQGKPVIEEISRMSRPGLRQYKAKGDIPEVKGGLGVVNELGCHDRSCCEGSRCRWRANLLRFLGQLWAYSKVER